MHDRMRILFYEEKKMPITVPTLSDVDPRFHDDLRNLIDNNEKTKLDCDLTKMAIDAILPNNTQTALHRAVRNAACNSDYEPLVQALLKAGADANVRDHAGEPPIMHVTGLLGNRRAGVLARMLIKGGASLTARRRADSNHFETLFDMFLERPEDSSASINTRYRHKISPSWIEGFNFTRPGFQGTVIMREEQGIANTQSLFSVFAEAIYLKTVSISNEKIALETMRQYSTLELSDRFWRNIREYGKRIHERLAQELKESQEPLTGDMKRLADMLTNNHLDTLVDGSYKIAAAMVESTLAQEGLTLEELSEKEQEEVRTLIQETATEQMTRQCRTHENVHAPIGNEPRLQQYLAHRYREATKTLVDSLQPQVKIPF